MNAAIAAQAWRGAGMSEAGIAGVLKNIQDESGFNPASRHFDQPGWTRRHGLGEPSYSHGLYQEGADEWINYQGWLSKNYPGSDWRDPKLQSEFAAQNLKTRYPGVWREMMQARSGGEAAAAYVRGYLKPSPGNLSSRYQRYMRGVPGIDYYTGGFDRVRPPVGEAVPTPRPRPQGIDDVWASRSMKGEATITLDARNMPRGMRADLSASGLFTKTRIQRSVLSPSYYEMALDQSREV
jgi:hypothetical protein